MSNTGVYRGVVYDLNDPAKLGRARLLVPAVYGNAVSGWAMPVFSVSQTEVGHPTWVMFENGDTNRPTWLASTPGPANMDDRYYTESEIISFLATKSPTTHGHSLADAAITGTLPNARFPSRLKETTQEGGEVADWNTIRTNGWYNSSTATNAPTSGWYIVEVVAHNTNYVTQKAWAFTNTSGTDSMCYERRSTNGVWTAWRRVRYLEGELDARYALTTDSRLSDARTPTAHSHPIGDLPVAPSGTVSSTQVPRADDSRLSNARTPTPHTHPVGDLTATGTKSTSTFLRGDNTWASPPPNGGGVISRTSGAASRVQSVPNNDGVYLAAQWSAGVTIPSNARTVLISMYQSAHCASNCLLYWFPYVRYRNNGDILLNVDLSKHNDGNPAVDLGFGLTIVENVITRRGQVLELYTDMRVASGSGAWVHPAWLNFEITFLD